MKSYKIYVADAKGWDRNCADSQRVFFGDLPNYVHHARGGIKPAGHIVVSGYKAAMDLLNELNKDYGYWDGGKPPIYAIATGKAQPFLNIGGMQFGRLTVTDTWEFRTSKKGHKERFWLCVCSCPLKTQVWITTGGLTSGNTKSCGCLRTERLRERAKIFLRHGGRPERHGYRKKDHPLYSMWANMVQRCHDPNHKDYKRYGAKGVQVCERWRSFWNFADDVGERPDGFSIDRYPNRKGNYEPGNWRWATNKEQAENKDSTRFVIVDHIRETVRETARRVGIEHKTLRMWMNRGFEPQEIVDEWRRSLGGRGNWLFKTRYTENSESVKLKMTGNHNRRSKPSA